MRFFIILITLIIGGVYLFSEFKADDIAKNIIENKATEASQREVKIKNLKIDFLKEQITLKNISIKNKDGFPGELLKIKDVKIITNLKSVMSDTVEVKLVDIKGINFQYKVSIRNGQIVDNLSLINQALKQQKSISGGSNKNDKVYPQKEKDKNFIIKKLTFKNAYAEVVSEDLQVNTNTKLSDMEFLNVGNSKNANHFKDVAAMILTNIIAKVQNDILKQKVKQKFEKKIKNLKKDILNELLKGNEKDLFKKFDKLLKNKKCNGVSHKYGDELVKGGVKFSRKLIEDKLFPKKNIYYDMNSLNVPEESSLIQDVVLEDWTDDKKVNDSVSRAVKNYVIKRNDLASKFKKEKFSNHKFRKKKY